MVSAASLTVTWVVTVCTVPAAVTTALPISGVKVSDVVPWLASGAAASVSTVGVIAVIR